MPSDRRPFGLNATANAAFAERDAAVLFAGSDRPELPASHTSHSRTVPSGSALAQLASVGTKLQIKDFLRVGSPTSRQIAALYGQDDQLQGAQPEQLESLARAREAPKGSRSGSRRGRQARSEAQRRTVEEEKAASLAGDAKTAAEKACREAEARAREAQAAADPTQPS
jgi:hypothetical protein